MQTPQIRNTVGKILAAAILTAGLLATTLQGAKVCTTPTDSGACSPGDYPASCSSSCVVQDCDQDGIKTKLCLGSGATKECKTDSKLTWSCTQNAYRTFCSGGSTITWPTVCDSVHPCIGCDTSGPTTPVSIQMGTCVQAYLSDTNCP